MHIARPSDGRALCCSVIEPHDGTVRVACHLCSDTAAVHRDPFVCAVNCRPLSVTDCGTERRSG